MTRRALVIGAGPAGLGAALQLTSWCPHVDVVEARPRDGLRHVGEHIPPAAIAELAALGLEPLLDNPHHGISYGVRSAWGEAAFAQRDYMFTLQGHGVNLDRTIFDEALAKQAEAAGAHLFFGTRLTALEKFQTGYAATLRKGDQRQEALADIVIDASGRNARAVRILGGTVARQDDMVGIFGRVSGCDPGQAVGQLLIEAVEHGWLYGVTFENGQGLVTLIADAQSLRGMPGGALRIWREAIMNSACFAKLFCLAGLADTVEVFDAACQCSTGLDTATCLAVGDAAMAYDPLSSWGIIKGLRDGFDGAAALQREALGQTGAVNAHRRRQADDYTEHLETRRAYYRVENRWPTAPFWRARQEMHAAV